MRLLSNIITWFCRNAGNLLALPKRYDKELKDLATIMQKDALMDTAEARGSTVPLEIRLLGTFAVHVHGKPLERLRSRQGQWLLALLVLRQGMDTDREWLASTLWPDSSTAQALYNLRRNLSN